MVNNKILDRIEVKTGSSLFRKYQLTHTTNELNYQHISLVLEFNGNNEASNPVLFTYDSTENEIDVVKNTLNDQIDFNNPNFQFSGDVDGDGHLDVIADNKPGFRMLSNDWKPYMTYQTPNSFTLW